MTYTDSDQRADTAFLVGARYGREAERTGLKEALAEAWDEGHAMAHGYDLSYEIDRGEWLEEHGEMAKAKNPYREGE